MSAPAGKSRKSAKPAVKQQGTSASAQVAVQKTIKPADQSQEKIKQLQKEIKKLKEENETLKSNPNEFLEGQFQAKENKLTEENKTLQKKNTKLTEEIEDLKTKLKSQINQITVTENKPKTEQSNENADNSGGRGSKDNDKETVKLQRNLDEERKVHKSTQQKLEMERRKINEMQERLDKFQKSESLKVSTERENKEHNTKIDQLQGELDGEKEAHRSTKKDLQRLKEENEDLRVKLTSQTNQVPVTENKTKTKQSNEIADKSSDRESKERDTKIDQLQRKLDEEKEAHKSTKENLKMEREKHKSELGKLQGELVDARNAHKSTQKELETREKHKSELGKLQGELVDARNAHKSTQKELETLREEHKAELVKLQRKLDVEKQAHKSTQKKLETLQNSPKNGKQNQPESEVVKNLKNEVDSLKNRLSQVAGTKLTEGNPNIADLSDSNRPINLAEKFSELYDNEWTDALEEVMEDNDDEEASIQILLEIVKGTFEFCQKQSSSFLEEMKKGLQVVDIKDDEKDWAPGISKQLKDLRKSLSVLVVGNIQKKYQFDKKTSNFKEHAKKYIDACVRICWFMSVQDPPVVIDAAKPTGKFDGDKYRAYTKTGKSYKYLVWPILYLHENGPMLGKGIAQGK